jgi:hypothetical protein
MALSLRGLVVLACAALLHGQTANPAPAQRTAGLETEWDISVVLGEMGAHAGRLLAALDRTDAKAWVGKGASETYVEQLDSCKRQVKAFQDGAIALASDPEKFADALELLFRIEGANTMLGSLGEGIRKYQSPEDAQALAALVAENGINLGRFQKYIVDLAAERERRFAVMDGEAQRCRGFLFDHPPAAPPTSGRKK